MVLGVCEVLGFIIPNCVKHNPTYWEETAANNNQDTSNNKGSSSSNNNNSSDSKQQQNGNVTCRRCDPLLPSSKDNDQNCHYHADVIIVGGGMAGLYTALALKEKILTNNSVMILEGSCVGEGASGKSKASS